MSTNKCQHFLIEVVKWSWGYLIWYSQPHRFQLSKTQIIAKFSNFPRRNWSPSILCHLFAPHFAMCFLSFEVRCSKRATSWNQPTTGMLDIACYLQDGGCGIWIWCPGPKQLHFASKASEPSILGTTSTRACNWGCSDARSFGSLQSFGGKLRHPTLASPYLQNKLMVIFLTDWVHLRWAFNVLVRSQN